MKRYVNTWLAALLLPTLVTLVTLTATSAARSATRYPSPNALYSQTPLQVTKPLAQTLSPIIEVEWERVHGGTLDGVFYSDLYWGGIGNSSPTLVDIDGDGDLDLFVSSGDDLHFFRNDGTPAAPVWTHLTTNYFSEYNRHAQFADLDGDGDYDCVLAGWPWEPEGFIYYENTGSASEPAWALRTTDMLGDGRTSDGENFALVDIDGDGDLDLFFVYEWEDDGNWHTAIAFYENTGSPSAPAWTFVTDTYADIVCEGSKYQCFMSIAFVDTDTDDDPDLFLGETDWIRHYRNDGTASAPVWTFVTDKYGDISLYESNLLHYILTFGDLDGNGTLDLIFGHGLGWLVSVKNVGTPANASWELWVNGVLPMDFGGASVPALADIDNDGDLDLLLGVGLGLDRAGLVFVRNDGTPAEPLWTYVPGNYDGIEIWGWEHPTFVDIDGDGDLDLFIGTLHFFGPSEPGLLYFYENTGTPEVPAFNFVTDNYVGISAADSRVVPAFADIDGDGDQDLFVAISQGGGPGRVHFYRNDGNATSPVWTFITDNYMGIQAKYLAFSDVDGDGDLDLFTERAFYRNDGDATEPVWVQRNLPYGLAWNGGPPVLGDLLGNDGRPDLLLGGNGGVHLYRNVRGVELWRIYLPIFIIAQ